jgi:hypothetical protein
VRQDKKVGKANEPVLTVFTFNRPSGAEKEFAPNWAHPSIEVRPLHLGPGLRGIRWDAKDGGGTLGSRTTDPAGVRSLAEAKAREAYIEFGIVPRAGQRISLARMGLELIACDIDPKTIGAAISWRAGDDEFIDGPTLTGNFDTVSRIAADFRSIVALQNTPQPISIRIYLFATKQGDPTKGLTKLGLNPFVVFGEVNQ